MILKQQSLLTLEHASIVQVAKPYPTLRQGTSGKRRSDVHPIARSSALNAADVVRTYLSNEINRVDREPEQVAGQFLNELIRGEGLSDELACRTRKRSKGLTSERVLKRRLCPSD